LGTERITVTVIVRSKSSDSGKDIMKNDLANQPVFNKVCVLYDPKDGRVVHTHRVLTMPGGEDVSDEELEARAKDMAHRAGHDVTSLWTLRVPGEECDGSSQYRVDLAMNKLQKLERPSRSAPRPA
jgi:hypothetical protein